MRKILIATTNPGKAAELSKLLGSDIDFVSLADFPGTKEVPETGSTFAENARLKAVGYSLQANLPTIADDSGLVIDALDGAPGVKSARFSGEKNKGLLDHKNMEKVLGLMKDVPEGKRAARFVCSMCLAEGKKVLIETQGELDGVIAKIEAGTKGFGYDPIFYVPSLAKTAAQLSSGEKNAISHRFKAASELKAQLSKFDYG